MSGETGGAVKRQTGKRERTILRNIVENLEKINFTQQQMKECSAENRKHKKKNLWPHLNRFLTEKSCEISRKIELSCILLVRCADKAAHSALPQDRLPQTPGTALA